MKPARFLVRRASPAVAAEVAGERGPTAGSVSDRDGRDIRVLLSGGGLEFDDQLGGHSSAVFYLYALSLGPLADLGGV
jgi:hypothetical protein